MSPSNITFYTRHCLYRECHSAGWKIETRTIPDHELVLITGGSGSVSIEGKVYNAKQGVLFYFYPNLVHSLESSIDNPMKFYAVHFSYTYINYLNGQWFIESEDKPLPIMSSAEMHTFLKQEVIFKELINHWAANNSGNNLLCDSLLIKLYHNILQDARINNINYSSKLKINEVIKYIKQNLGKEFTVTELAATVNLSPDYLSSVFRSFTGYTIIKYINKLRIDTAKGMLINDHKKIKEIAAQLGFNDEFYFSKTFKKFEGLSPSEFCSKYINSMNE